MNFSVEANWMLFVICGVQNLFMFGTKAIYFQETFL